MKDSEIVKEIYFVITTESDKRKAHKLAKLLLREKIIACVTFKNIESYYWWKGKINQSKEVELIIKCNKKNISKVCKIISENHSYELPELTYFPVSTSENYYKWVSSNDLDKF